MVLCITSMTVIFSESETQLVQRSGLQDSGNSTLLWWLTAWRLQVGYLVSHFSHLQIRSGDRHVRSYTKRHVKITTAISFEDLNLWSPSAVDFLSASISDNFIFSFKRHSFLKINVVRFFMIAVKCTLYFCVAI